MWKEKRMLWENESKKVRCFFSDIKEISEWYNGKLTVFPFSSQVIEGTGFPVALHSKTTSVPICTFLSLGTLSILAGAEDINRHYLKGWGGVVGKTLLCGSQISIY